MKIVFTFDEISRIIFEYVQDNMNTKVDHIKFEEIGDDQICIVTKSKKDGNK